MMTDIPSMARIALAILWGGALCGLGAQALLSSLSAMSMEGPSDRKNVAAGAAFFLSVAFFAATLYTLSVAEIFHFMDWMKHRS